MDAVPAAGRFADRERIAANAAGLVDQRRGSGPADVVQGGLMQRREDALEGIVEVHAVCPFLRLSAVLRPARSRDPPPGARSAVRRPALRALITWVPASPMPRDRRGRAAESGGNAAPWTPVGFSDRRNWEFLLARPVCSPVHYPSISAPARKKEMPSCARIMRARHDMVTRRDRRATATEASRCLRLRDLRRPHAARARLVARLVAARPARPAARNAAPNPAARLPRRRCRTGFRVRRSAKDLVSFRALEQALRNTALGRDGPPG